jgi:signal recognition particle receptor subunit beta
VADGTRPETLETAINLYRETCKDAPGIPALLLFNKADLKNDWKLDEYPLESSIQSFKTSALDGMNVEKAFTTLATHLVAE